MRQTLINAAIHMAYSLGIRSNAWKLPQKLDMKDAALKADFMQYVEPATEMFELAKEMAMTAPEGSQNNYYEGVGIWYATFCREEGKLPSREEMLVGMADGIGMMFKTSLNNTQFDSLVKKLAEFE